MDAYRSLQGENADLMQPLRLAVITDHLAGHTRQCEAIVAAIAEVSPVDVTYMSSRVRSPVRSHHFRRFILSLPGAAALLPMTVSGEWKKPFDLVISASGSTLTGNILLKRRNKARNIFSGQPRRIKAGDVDCILAHASEHAVTPYHVFGKVPVLRFPRPAAPFCKLAGSQLGVIIGGPASGVGFDFTKEYCDGVFAHLREIEASVPNIRWVVVTSRRTPDEAYPVIEAFCSEAANCDFIDYRNAGLGSISRAFGSDGILVTEDSQTMISEFAGNGYPVVVIGVPHPSEKAHSFANRMAARGEVVLMQPDEITPAALEAAFGRIEVSKDDVYQRIRAQIASRISGLF